jgi:Cu/Ag efflux protein CusF
MRIIARVVCATSVLLAAPFVVAVPAGSAIAQQMRLDPSDPATSVAAPTTASAFADYQPFREQKIAPWKQVLDEVAGVPGAAGHAGHSAVAATTTEPQAPSVAEKPTAGPGAAIMATGVVKSIDKANGKVKLIHDPIAVLGWPKMTMFFHLKDAALADQVKEGDAVQFSLEKSPSGYVISGFKKAMSDNDMRDMDKGDKQ